MASPRGFEPVLLLGGSVATPGILPTGIALPSRQELPTRQGAPPRPAVARRALTGKQVVSPRQAPLNVLQPVPADQEERRDRRQHQAVDHQYRGR